MKGWGKWAKDTIVPYRVTTGLKGQGRYRAFSPTVCEDQFDSCLGNTKPERIGNEKYFRASVRDFQQKQLF